MNCQCFTSTCCWLVSESVAPSLHLLEMVRAAASEVCGHKRHLLPPPQCREGCRLGQVAFPVPVSIIRPARLMGSQGAPCQCFTAHSTAGHRVWLQVCLHHTPCPCHTHAGKTQAHGRASTHTIVSLASALHTQGIPEGTALLGRSDRTLET